MEDVASEHAAILDLSIDRLLAQGIAWVLAKMQIEIVNNKPLTDTVTVHTWPVEVSKLQFRRDFEVYTASGELYARAITQWVIVNMTSRRVEKIPDFVAALHPHNPKYSMPESKWRIEAQLEAPHLADLFVTPADIDINKHVNNVRYVDWVMDSVPMAFRNATALEILYRAEAVEGERLEARGQVAEENQFQISLIRDRAELVRARITNAI
jgi:acyl-ACP thioesterase